MSADYILSLILLLAVYSDIKYRKIYNKITMPGILLGFLVNIYEKKLIAGLLFSFEGLVLGILLFILPFILGGLGGGDVKLMGAVGAFKGPLFVFYAIISAALVNGIFAMLFLAREKKLFFTLKKIYYAIVNTILFKSSLNPEDIENKNNDKIKIPYGIGLAIGTFLIILLQHFKLI